MNEAIQILPIVIGAYEAISHIVPSKKNHSLLRKIFSVLIKISDFVNVIKKPK